ncbi:hypothetical protein BC941DRAFT_427712 [Chlamydoabsidia padenii]|nr:hypothetical protein BC941DRAFT_427712 [Chlamydoabsidia padenii]
MICSIPSHTPFSFLLSLLVQKVNNTMVKIKTFLLLNTHSNPKKLKITCILHIMSIETVQVDSTAWPSTYYGRGKRVDLEQFFLKVQQEQQAIEQQRNSRHVRFSPDPPQVHVYEAEYDSFDRLVSSIENSKDTWPSHARRPPQKLDLRPVINQHYVVSTRNRPVSPERRFSSTSSIAPSTPPLSPSPWLSPLDDDDSSDEEDKQPSPVTPLSPLPFSPSSLTKKFTSVFSRKKRNSMIG